jgi:hypothetical protein
MESETGAAPAWTPVPAPWGTIGVPNSCATRTTATTSAVLRGRTAMNGGAGGRSSGSFARATPQAIPR